jgi:hypothetical protein
MSLDKAINNGKEYRKQYRDSRRFDHSCRNHGSCSYCEQRRLFNDIKNRTRADDDIYDYENEYVDHQAALEKEIDL